MNLLQYLTQPFKNNYKLLLLASLPALVLCAFGLHQLEVMAPLTWITTLALRLITEFLFLGLLLALLNLIGIKNKWVLSALLFAYYVTLTADFVLLWYFKERFGAKYLQTMEGGDYAFLTDWRTLSYFTFFVLFCLVCVRKFFTASPRKTAANQLLVCAVALGLMTVINPAAFLPKPDNFFAQYLLPPAPVYTLRALLTRPLKANVTLKPSQQVLDTAAKYNVFTARNTGAGKDYKRVIFIATESLSGKYLHTFNPLIPATASQTYDDLFASYPSTALHSVTLSTLYGLSVIFSSHPFAQLSYENGYPISFVRRLQENGFETAFFRGANETYMDENILFHKAGFSLVRGSQFFEKTDKYKDFIDWWGLTDRKLYEYATEYLQENKDKKVFLTLLTVDTHVPLGRNDYLGQDYPEIDAEFYNLPTMPRAFARDAEDLKRFIANLQKRGLFDEETLIFVTGDHPSYANMPTDKLFKPYQKTFDQLPFIMVTKTRIAHPVTSGALVSQLDIAPTVMDLLNLPQEKGFFGHSLFENTPRSIFDIKEDYAVVTTESGRQVLPLNSGKKAGRDLIELMTTFWIAN